MGINSEYELTKAGIMKKLEAIVDSELSKPYEEIDRSLVDECVNFLMELREEKELTKEEILTKVKAIPFVGKKTSDKSQKKKRFGVRKALLTAAILIIIAILGSIVASSFGTDAVDILRRIGHGIAEMASGEKLDVGGITIVKLDSSEEYGSVEELLEKEQIHIMYPTYLPEGSEVEKIHMTEFDGITEIIFQIKGTDTVSLGVYLDCGITEEEEKAAERTETVNGMLCLFVNAPDRIQVAFEYKGNKYVVGYNDYDELIRIIENLEEVKENEN